MTIDVHARDLRHFVAVAGELHFTGAAERLYGIGPSRHVPAWRREDEHRPLVRGYAQACRQTVSR